MRLNHQGMGKSRLRGRFVLMLGLLAAFGAACLKLDTGRPAPSARGRAASYEALAQRPHGVPPGVKLERPPIRSLQADFARLPIMFEPNVGQTDPQVQFLARGGGYALFLTEGQAVLRLRSSVEGGAGFADSAIAMELVASNRMAKMEASERLPGHSNYLIGSDRSRWHRNIPQFARVRYNRVYPGIDLVYYGTQGHLEYDFEVAPGADAGAIAWRFHGLAGLDPDSSGDLILSSAAGQVKLGAPAVYQQYGSERRRVAAKFRLRGNHQVGFEVADYDRSRALVIDPVLSYSTYLGGTGTQSCSTITGNQVLAGVPGTPGCPAIAVDNGLNFYLAGSTESANFPPQPGVVGSLTGTANVIVAKLNSAGTALQFSTYIGGTGKDYTGGIAVDAGLDVVVAGTTSSPDFPTNNGLPVSSLSANNHGFVTRLDASGSNILYSTYLAGSGVDTATGVAVDSLENIYVTGTTQSPAFPTSGGFPTTLGALQTGPNAINQFFLTKINPSNVGTDSLLYSTYLGGSTPANGLTVGGGIAVDVNCDAYVAGGTNFTDMPVLNASQATEAGGLDAWLGEFKIPVGSTCSSSNASTLTQNYLTYVGGSGDDVAEGIAVDSSLTAYITGYTDSTNFPNATGTNGVYDLTPYQPAYGGGASDAFVARFGQPSANTTGTTSGLVPYLYFTYLGGPGADAGLAVAVDTTGGARITGLTNGGFPVTANNNVQASYGGGNWDAFVARLDTTSTATCTTTTVTSCPNYASYLGGNGTDIGTGIAIDTVQSTYVTGETSSTNFPLSSAPFQASLTGPSDIFASKLGPKLLLTTTATTNSNGVVNSNPVVGIGNQVDFVYTITNDGDPATSIIFTDYLPSTGVTFVSAKATSGTCAQTGTTIACNVGTLSSGGTDEITIVLAPTVAGAFTNVGAITSPILEPSVSAPAVTVNDYQISSSPNTETVQAGVPALYTISVGPAIPGASIPNSISLACGTLPNATSCTFTDNPIATLTHGTVTRTLEITTTERVTTTTGLRPPPGPWYATWLPIGAMALLGVGWGRKHPGRGRWAGLLLGMVFALVCFQAACGGATTVTSTSGTAAGTYTIDINATSGSTTHTAAIQLVVQ